MTPKDFANFGKLYLGAAYGYGILHKYAILWDAQVETYVKNELKMRPMLAGEKLCAFCVSMVYCPFLAPIWATETIDRIDMLMMGKKPDEIGYNIKRTSFLDYVFH